MLLRQNDWNDLNLLVLNDGMILSSYRILEGESSILLLICRILLLELVCFLSFGLSRCVDATGDFSESFGESFGFTFEEGVARIGTFELCFHES